MATLTANFEAGTNGATVATGDVGSATAWDNVTTGTGSTFIYDTAHAAHGKQALKLATGVTSVGPHVDWTTAFGTQTDHYGRVYVYFTANPAAVNRLIRTRSATPANACSIEITSSGKITISDSTGTIKATSTNSIALNRGKRQDRRLLVASHGDVHITGGQGRHRSVAAASAAPDGSQRPVNGSRRLEPHAAAANNDGHTGRTLRLGDSCR